MSNLFRRGKTWWGRVQAAGRDHRRSLRTSDRAEAKRRLEAWIAKVNHAEWYGHERPSYKATVARWTAEYLNKAVRPSTAKRYLVSVRQLDPHFRGLFLDQISRRTIADYVSARTRAGASNATIRRDLTALSTILSCAASWGWLEHNPAKDYDRKVIRERREPIKPPTDAEVAELIGRCPKGFGDVIRFLAGTGMRQSEALTLTWSDIDFRAGTITLRRTKTGRARTIQIETIVGTNVGTLQGRPRHIASPYVFWHGEGQNYKNFASRFRQYAAGRKGQKPLTFRCHDLRHKFAIDWLKAGGDIYALSRHLGHSSVKTTEIYLGYVGTKPGTVVGGFSSEVVG